MKSQKSTFSKAKNTTEVNALIEKFNQQEHRLEINDCELVYNGKKFSLENTIEELESIIGKPDVKDQYGAMWANAHVDARIRGKENKIYNIYIYITGNYKEIIDSNENIVLMNGIPITREMNFGDFIDNSTYEFDDFSIHRSFKLRPENCSIVDLNINFNSKPIFNYSGGGHLQLRGDFNSQETYPIKSISIYKATKK